MCAAGKGRVPFITLACNGFQSPTSFCSSPFATSRQYLSPCGTSDQVSWLWSLCCLQQQLSSFPLSRKFFPPHSRSGEEEEWNADLFSRPVRYSGADFSLDRRNNDVCPRVVGKYGYCDAVEKCCIPGYGCESGPGLFFRLVLISGNLLPIQAIPAARATSATAV